MSSLSQLRQSSAAPATTGPSNQHNAFGVVLNVATAQVVNDALVLTGSTLTQNAQLAAGSQVKVTFRGDAATRAVSNWTKGNGKSSLATPEKSAGTFVTLESCYLTGEKDGDQQVLSARWLNTLAQANNEDHRNRSFVENIIATAPRLIFDNPNPQAGEPRSITLPVNAEKIRAKVDVDGQSTIRQFDRAWVVDKLKNVSAGKKVQVVIDTLEPSESEKVSSKDELESVLREQLARGTKSMSMIRVSDGEEIATRLIYVPFKRTTGEDGKAVYAPDVDQAISDLFKYNIVKDVNNEVLAGAIADGQLVAEVIPGYRMTYAGDTSRDDNAAYKMIQDVIAGKNARFDVLFGKDPTHYAKVILTGISRVDTIDGFSPTNVMSEESGYLAPHAFPTPHIDAARLPDAAAPDEAEEESASLSP